jgi:alkanesulfonate monooxygenase SsuD/methylene tetrahydromethanopterin reductase-like flavin-dependent oxidoreductase (luciferase family)
VAEDIAMLSWLTRGRALLGLGTAHQPPDFGLYGVDRATRFDRLPEMIDVIRACWSGEPFDIDGEFGHWAGQVTPVPYGGVAPEVWLGAHGTRGLALAGTKADMWLADPQRHVDVAAALATRYRDSAEAAGRPARVALFRDGWVGETRADCERDWLPHAMAVHRLYFNVGVYHREFEPWVDQVRSRADFTPELVAPGRFLFGSPEQVRAEVTDWAARTGCEYIALRMRQPGGPSHRQTVEAIARFGAEVIAPLSTAPVPARR